MKTAIVLTAILGVCLGQYFPIAHHIPVVHISHPVVHLAQPSIKLVKPVAILKQSSELGEDGSFSYGFESEDGIKSSASGSVKVLSPEETAQVVQGSFSYTAPDGTPITRTYVADENGFRAEGADLPTPPPIPEAIARALELLPKLEEQEKQKSA